MDVTVYFEDGSEEEIKHVADVTWNETEAKDDPFVFWREKVSQILINFN